MSARAIVDCCALRAMTRRRSACALAIEPVAARTAAHTTVIHPRCISRLDLDSTGTLAELVSVVAGLVHQRNHQVRQRRALRHPDVAVPLCVPAPPPTSSA